MTEIGDEKESYIILSHEEWKKKMIYVIKFYDFDRLRMY